MGRAQVLYNRKKGRKTNRPGRGGGRGEDRDGPNNYNNKNRDNNNFHENNTNSRQRKTHTHLLSQQRQTGGSLENVDYSSNRKDYEQEYEVMFAGRDTYLSSQGGPTTDDDEEDEPSSFLSGRICIASMAATLESISIEQRMNLPHRVAATAFPSRYREKEGDGETNDNDVEETSKRKAATKIRLSASVAAVTAEDKEKNDDAEVKENMEDWLDDVCGTDETNQELSKLSVNPDGCRDTIATAATVIPSSADGMSKPASFANGNEKETTTKTANNALAKAAEAFDEDNLDDWLDSVI